MNIKQYACRIRSAEVPKKWERVRACLLRHVQGDVPPANGDRLLFFFKFSDGREIPLGLGTCKSTPALLLYRGKDGAPRASLDGLLQLPRETEWLAQEAGYGTSAAMLAYVEKTHGLPFNGLLLRW